MNRLKAAFLSGFLIFGISGGAPAFAGGENGGEEDIWQAGSRRSRPEAPTLDLSGTAIGRAAKSGDIADFFAELDKLKNFSPGERLKILQARDSKGNSLFHYMLDRRAERAEFAGAMLYLSFVLSVHGDHETVDDWNQDGLSPLEAAKKAENSIAAEYLVMAENRARESRGERAGISAGQPLDMKQARDLAQSEMGMKFILGGFASMNGWLFVQGGLEAGHIGMLLFGLPQLLVGAGACYQAFKTWKSLKE